jgi:DNA-binding transcriptional MerR regulator
MTTMTPFPERDPEDLLTLSEVAEILKVPINTLRWWRQIGTGPEFFKIGRHLVTTVGDVRRFIREQRRAQRPVLS